MRKQLGVVLRVSDMFMRCPSIRMMLKSVLWGVGGGDGGDMGDMHKMDRETGMRMANSEYTGPLTMQNPIFPGYKKYDVYGEEGP
jgi:hypothetical protein